jgi:hypothetical protein
MPKVLVIKDSEGRVIGSVRADPIETESGTLQFEAPSARAEGGPTQIQGQPVPELQYQERDVSEDLLAGPPEELHRELEGRSK